MSPKKTDRGMVIIATALNIIALCVIAFFVYQDIMIHTPKPDRCELAPGITCLDYSAKSITATSLTDTGKISLLINNGIGQTMYDLGINITGCKGDSGYNWTGAKSLSGGSTILITVNCDGLVGKQMFKSNVSLNYTTSVDGNMLSFTKVGYFVVKVEAE